LNRHQRRTLASVVGLAANSVASPIQIDTQSAAKMQKVMADLQRLFPKAHVTLLLSEENAPADRPPHFRYCSTAARAETVRAMQAFIDADARRSKESEQQKD